MPLPEQHPIVILGGGLAGLSAAMTLAHQGVACTVLETRRHLGGRAASTTEPRSGEEIDNCQHVALGCCTQYLAFLRQIGADHLLRWTTDQHWIHAPEGKQPTVSRISAAPLPAPMQGLPSLLGATFLDLPAKLAAMQLAARVMVTKRSGLADVSFLQWMRREGIESDVLVERLLTPIIVSACNCLPSQCSAEAALHVFQDAIFATPQASAIGVSRVPLSQLYARVPEMLAKVGSEIWTGAGVAEFDAHEVKLSDGRVLKAERVVCAMPFERTRALASQQLRERDHRIAGLDLLDHAPILGVHLKFAEAVCAYPHAVLVDRATQWVFRKDEEGRHLHCVISGALAWMNLSEAEIVERVCADLEACFEGARRQKPLWARTIKERRATFVPTPESYFYRPDVRSDEPGGVILAGDYTRTGWPATMESAVRSGAMAAAVALGQPEDTYLVPALPRPLLTSFLPSGTGSH